MAADEPTGPSGQPSELRNPFTGQTIRFVTDSEELVVPAGTPHEFGGHATEPGTVCWEVRPALRTREFFIRLFAALQAASDGNPEAAPFDFADYADEFRPA